MPHRTTVVPRDDAAPLGRGYGRGHMRRVTPQILAWLLALAGCAEPPAEEDVYVVVAARDLYQGVPITEHDLYGLSMPARFVPADTFRDPRDVVGRSPFLRILANDVVRGGRLADEERGVGLNALAPRGTHAVSLAFGADDGPAEVLAPGVWVDLVAPPAEDPVTCKVLRVRPSGPTTEVIAAVPSDRVPRVVHAAEADQLRFRGPADGPAWRPPLHLRPYHRPPQPHHVCRDCFEIRASDGRLLWVNDCGAPCDPAKPHPRRRPQAR
jgi:SAF domain